MTIGDILFLLSISVQAVNSFSALSGISIEPTEEIDLSAGVATSTKIYLNASNNNSNSMNLANKKLISHDPLAKEESETEHDISVSIQSILIMLRDDKSDYLLPLFSSSIDKLEFSLSGTEEKMMGSGETGFKIDYYNFNIGIWEPIVEPFKLTTSLKILKDSVSVEV